MLVYLHKTCKLGRHLVGKSHGSIFYCKPVGNFYVDRAGLVLKDVGVPIFSNLPEAKR